MADLTDQEIAEVLDVAAVRAEQSGGAWHEAAVVAALRDLARLGILDRAVHHEAECLAEVTAPTWRAWLVREGWEHGTWFNITVWRLGAAMLADRDDRCPDEDMLGIAATVTGRPRAAVLAELLELQEAP